MPLHRRVPKRGFHNPFRIEYAVVNLDTLAERFEAGTVVTPELLRERGLVPARRKRVKVLARGDITKRLTVRAHKFSGKAAEKIAAAGGAAEVCSRRRRAGSRDSARVRRLGYESNMLWKASRTCSPSPSCASACCSRWRCSSCTASAATSRRRA